MAQQSLYVCYRGNSGRHLLAASISRFDPKRSLGTLVLASFNPSWTDLNLGVAKFELRWAIQTK
jgi:hypothetical protein